MTQQLCDSLSIHVWCNDVVFTVLPLPCVFMLHTATMWKRCNSVFRFSQSGICFQKISFRGLKTLLPCGWKADPKMLPCGQCLRGEWWWVYEPWRGGSCSSIVPLPPTHTHLVTSWHRHCHRHPHGKEPARENRTHHTGYCSSRICTFYIFPS